MITIIHRIRLKPGISHLRFEAWVRDADYEACPTLPSVQGFAVHRVSTDPDAPCHYFEIIRIHEKLAFARDMDSPAFQKLVAGFAEMAEVVDEIEGEKIEPGYVR